MAGRPAVARGRACGALAAALAVAAAAPSSAASEPAGAASASQRSTCGQARAGGYRVIFDGSRRCLRRWRHAGGASIALQPDGTLQTRPGGDGLGLLWYTARRYRDFVLRLEFRDDSSAAGLRANSGVHVRFPAPRPPVRGCPAAADAAAWVAVTCGHEIQIHDAPDGAGDPSKTGSIYGFATLDAAKARVRPAGVWSDLEIRVVGQRYTVTRDGVRINDYRNRPGVPFPGRPQDPGSSGRGLAGYIGLQAHGGPQDVVSFRDIRVRSLPRRR